MAKKKISTNNIADCVLYGVIGLLLIILRASALEILMTIVGALLIVRGVLDVVNSKDLVRGVIEIAIGVVIIVCGWLIADVVLLVLGVLLTIKSAMEIAKNYKKGFKANLENIVTLVIGVLLIVAKWALMDAMCVIAGVIFLINAVLALLGKNLSK